MKLPIYPRQDSDAYQKMRAPGPPTGPLADIYSHGDNKPEKFVAFLGTNVGVAFMRSAAGAAISALECGDKRFSVLGYIHEYRALNKVRINNTYAPWVADELVKRHPSLLDIIERRKRKVVG